MVYFIHLRQVSNRCLVTLKLGYHHYPLLRNSLFLFQTIHTHQQRARPRPMRLKDLCKLLIHRNQSQRNYLYRLQVFDLLVCSIAHLGSETVRLIVDAPTVKILGCCRVHKTNWSGHNWSYLFQIIIDQFNMFLSNIWNALKIIQQFLGLRWITIT